MQGILGDMQRAEELARQRDAQYGMLSPEPSMMQRIGSQAKRLFFPEKDLYGNDPMHPSVFDSRYTPTKGATNQDAILDVVGGPLTFAGKLAKTADLGLLKKAQEMMGLGADRNAIWKETGWFKDVDDQWKFEIDDSWMQYNPWNLPEETVPFEVLDDKFNKAEFVKSLKEGSGIPTYKTGRVGQGLEHPQLTEAYPDINEMGLVENPFEGAKRGTYERSTWGQFDEPKFGSNEKISIYPKNIERTSEPSVKQWGISLASDQPKSVLAHELQHAIQAREGFASGGSAETVQSHYFDKLSKQYTPMIPLVRQGDALHKEESMLMKLAELEGYRNIKQPRHLFNSQQWYKHSHTIRRELGPTPKYSGQKRKDWVREAGMMLADIVQKEYAPHSHAMYNTLEKYGGSMDGVKKGLKNIRAKLNRLDKKGYSEAKKIKHHMDTHDPFNHEWNDDMKFRNYERLAGEAEARNVQTRLGMDQAERREYPPWETLDVPENELQVHMRNKNPMKGVLSGQ